MAIRVHRRTGPGTILALGSTSVGSFSGCCGPVRFDGVGVLHDSTH